MNDDDDKFLETMNLLINDETKVDIDATSLKLIGEEENSDFEPIFKVFRKYIFYFRLF
jgi:hypothetical protein